MITASFILYMGHLMPKTRSPGLKQETFLTLLMPHFSSNYQTGSGCLYLLLLSPLHMQDIWYKKTRSPGLKMEKDFDHSRDPIFYPITMKLPQNVYIQACQVRFIYGPKNRCLFTVTQARVKLYLQHNFCLFFVRSNLSTAVLFLCFVLPVKFLFGIKSW